MIFLNGVVPENVKRMLNEGRGDELENILLNGGSGGSGGGIDTSKLTEIFPVTELTAVAEFDGVAPVMSPFTLTAGDIFLVDWNGTGYACEAKPVNFNSLPIVGIGNTIALGGENTGEPFAVGCIPEELTIHTNGAYGLVVPLDGSTTFKVGIYRIGKSAGTVLEDLPIAIDFSSGENQTIVAPDGCLVESAIIEKPENLKPEYILEGINIAGIIGTLVPGGGEPAVLRVGKTATSCAPYIPVSKPFNVQGTWTAVTWTGLSSDPNKGTIWTDGSDVYYSYNGVLEKGTTTWTTKSWVGYSYPGTIGVWTDGTDIYISGGSSQYVLNKETSTWSTKTWTGLSNSQGQYIWTDGENFYHSQDGVHYVLNRDTSTWSRKTWTGLSSFSAKNVWSDGTDVYLSISTVQQVLNKETSTWSTKTWTGLTNFDAENVWTDGENIYYSNGSSQYRLNKETSTWVAVTWNGLSEPVGSGIWTDGTNLYYSNGTGKQYVLTA